VNVLDHLRVAGPKGLRASLLIELVDQVQPYPPAIVLLRQLVDGGYISAVPAPIVADSVVVLTDDGDAQLAAAKSAGAWLCRGVTVTRRTVLTEAGLLEFLKAIEHGDVTLNPDIDPNEVYAGVVPYAASNGWHIAIFNDCNVWDYIEWVEAGGERVTYEHIIREMPEIQGYRPSRETAERAYKIPRVTTKRPADPENLDADDRAFAQLHEVLEGRRRLRLDGASSKMLRLILGGNTDTVITPERFVVHFGAQKQRLPSRYYRRSLRESFRRPVARVPTSSTISKSKGCTRTSLVKRESGYTTRIALPRLCRDSKEWECAKRKRPWPRMDSNARR
jgi:hypothetical protein